MMIQWMGRIARQETVNSIYRYAVLGFLMLPVCSSVRADIVYSLSGQTIGNNSVSGTITTNGTIGAISASDIVSADLMVSSGDSSFPLDAVPLAFETVEATPTFLEWQGFGFDTIQFSDDVGGTGMNRWLLLRESATERVLIVNGALERVTVSPTPHVFAVVIPEPDSFLLILTGGIVVLACRPKR